MRYLITCALILCTLLAQGQRKSVVDSLDHLIDSLPTGTEKCRVIRNIMNTSEVYGVLLPEQRREYAELGLRVAEEPRQKYASLSILAIYYSDQGNLSESLRWAKEGLAITENDTISRLAAEAAFHNLIGVALKRNGQQSKALEHFLIAKKNAVELGQDRQVAIANSNIANIYSWQERYEEALVLHIEKLHIEEAYGAHYNVLSEQINIASVLISMNKLDTALSICYEVLEAARRDSLVSLWDQSMFFLAHAYREKGELEKAKVYLDSSLIYSQLYDGPRQVSATYELRATVHVAAGNYEAALQDMNQSLSILEPLAIPQRLSVLYSNLSETHQKQGNFEQALQYKLLETQIEDSLDIIDRAQIFSDIETTYEMEKQDAANRILEQENQIQTLTIAENKAQMTQSRTIWISVVVGLLLLALTGFLIQNQARVKRESQLAQKLAQVELKALRAQMNPHFTFNTMNSIQHYIEGRDTEAAKRYLSKFGRLIRQMLENSGSQWVTIEEELEQLQLYMELEALRFAEPFDFNVVLDESLDASFDRIPPMLLQPFLENAVWHGIAHKSGKGAIELSIKAKDELLLCVITDNGVGRKQSAALKSKNTTDHKSMGVSITRDRLEMLTGNVSTVGFSDLKDEEGNIDGTKVELSIPMN